MSAVLVDTFYYVHLIQNVATATCDVLTSLSAASPTIPSGFRLIGRIGAFLYNNNAEIEPFVQVGAQFGFKQAIEEDYRSYGNTSLTEWSVYYGVTFSIPPQLDIEAILHVNGHQPAREYCNIS